MKEEYAICLDLTGRVPGVLIGGWWAAHQLMRENEMNDIGTWVMSRGGCARGKSLHMAPSPDCETKNVLFVGAPLDGVHFVEKTKDVGLNVHILVFGVDYNTPPVSPRLFRVFHSIHAMPETKRWLAGWGVEDVKEFNLERPKAEPFQGKKKKELQIVAVGNVNTSPLKAWSAGKGGFDERRLDLTDDNAPVSLDAVAQVARGADVCVVSGTVLDDPIRRIMDDHGVRTVVEHPKTTLVSRAVWAARQSREEMFASPPQKRRGDKKDYRLAIIIPFGGIDRAGLKMSLPTLVASAPEGTQIIVSHQVHARGQEGEDEAKVVNQICVDNEVDYCWSKSDTWRLGKARNTGAEFVGHDVTHITFLDVDTIPSQGFFTRLREAYEQFGDVVLVPHIVGSPSGEIRIATGIATYPVSVFNRAGGFSEEFSGWGYEDLELLLRLKRSGVPAMILDSPAEPLLVHIDHDQRWADTIAANHRLWVKSTRRSER